MTKSAVKPPVAIIGAGIVGVSTAIWLQRAGIATFLIDKEGPAAGTSYGNAGVLASASVVPVTVPGLIGKAPGMLLDKNQPLFLNWSYLPTLLPWLARYLSYCKPEKVNRIATALSPLLSNSLQDHQLLAAGTDAAKYINPCDYVYAYKDRKHFDSDAFGWQVRKEHGFNWTEYEGTDLKHFDPVLATAQNFAASVHNHGRISDPGCYVQQLALAYEKGGGKIIKGTVEDFIIEQQAITGIRSDGNTLDCSATVVATGAWSKALMKKLGCSIPLESERGYHIELYNPSVMPKMPCMIASGKFVMTPMDGRLRIAGMVEFGGLIAGANKAPIDFLRRTMNEVIPDLKWTDTKEWLGHRPAPIDSVPVIGETPTVKGAFVGFGHQHVGLTGGARTGQLLAQLIAGESITIDMAPYRVDRFD